MQFKENIRQYNSAMGFASFGANLKIPSGPGPYCFKFHGQIYHQFGTLHPPQGVQPSYSQLYIIEGNNAVDTRLRHTGIQKCTRQIMTMFTVLLDRVNPYAAAYKLMKQVKDELNEQARVSNVEPLNVSMVLKPGNDQRR